MRRRGCQQPVIWLALLSTLILLSIESGVSAGPSSEPVFVSQLFINDISQPSTTDPAQEKSSMPTLESYWKAIGQIQGTFYSADAQAPPNIRTLTYAAIRGVLSSLNDPYTRFLSPEQFREMQNENRGSFPGIGVELQSLAGRILIAQIVPGSPAAKAPLMTGDELLKVGSTIVSGKTTDAVGALLRGEEGTPVTLTVLRGGKTLVFALVRKEVTYPHFESRVMDGSIGYMHLLMFDEQAGANIAKALTSFKQRGVRGIILDLRDNPGGLLNSAVDVASKFIPPGAVVWVQERGGQRNSLSTNDEARTSVHPPLVVLVNHYSASASEIVSGAIKDTHSGVVVGITTWGKGLVQEIIPLDDDSAIALTTAHYFTPSGTDINLKGVAPDIVVGHIVPEPEDESSASQKIYDQERAQVDADQLARAMAVLAEQIGKAQTDAKLAFKP